MQKFLLHFVVDLFVLHQVVSEEVLVGTKNVAERGATATTTRIISLNGITPPETTATKTTHPTTKKQYSALRWAAAASLSAVTLIVESKVFVNHI